MMGLPGRLDSPNGVLHPQLVVDIQNRSFFYVKSHQDHSCNNDSSLTGARRIMEDSKGVIMKSYNAPWAMSLIVISSLCTAVCIGAAIWSLRQSGWKLEWTALIPIVVLCGCVLFIIRGYTVTSDAILVHRLLWTTRLRLTDLQSADFEPNAMRRSLRLFGNGGLFAFSGWFRNHKLGRYRAFVTDPERTVVLHFTRRTVLVSPSLPEDFVRAVAAAGQLGS